MAAFGIHFGASNSCLAVYKDGNAEVIANVAGDRTTPTLVAFSDHDKVVGLPARQGLVRNAKNTVCHSKRLLGRGFSEPEVQNELKNSQCKIVEKEGKPVYQVMYMESQKLFSPQQCTTFVFETLLDLAKHHGDSDVHDVVLSIPSDFADDQRTAIRCAAEKGGFNLLRFIHEPTSALLAYDIGQKHHHDHIYGMVVRIGGSSCTVSCYSIANGMYKLLSNTHTNQLGGDMFTQLIAEQFSKDFHRQYRVDPKSNNRSWNKLINAAETCKHTLTKLPSAHCSVDSLHEGIDFSGSIARARVDLLSQSLLTKLQNILEESLTTGGLTKDQIQKVVLSGGATKLPCVFKKIQDHLSSAEVHSSLPADEVIALGAAKQAGIILSNSSSNDITPTASVPSLQEQISVIVQGSEPELLFSAGYAVPAKTKKTFCSSKSSFRMVVTQGTDHQTILAKVMLGETSEGSVIEAQFSLDTDGSLHISCVDEVTKTKSELIVPVSNEASPSPRS